MWPLSLETSMMDTLFHSSWNYVIIRLKLFSNRRNLLDVSAVGKSVPRLSRKAASILRGRVFLTTRKDLQNYRSWRLNSYNSLWYLHLRFLLAPLPSFSLYSFSLKFYKWGLDKVPEESQKKFQNNKSSLLLSTRK